MNKNRRLLFDGLAMLCLAWAWPEVCVAGAIGSGAPAASVSFDGTLTEAVSGHTGTAHAKPEFAKGREGQAARVVREPFVYAAPAGFDWERGTVEMWIRPDTDCIDDTYRMFFDLKRRGKGGVYLIKSGTGGANGLFLCVYDEKGKWMAASVSPPHAYSWQAGEWHHIGGSWDAPRGVLKLFFDHREVATTKVAGFKIGPVADRFSIGGNTGGGQLALGLVDEFRLHQTVATQSPIPSALNVRGSQADAWRLIDHDTSDLAAWNGAGCPNWVEVELPEPIDLAQVVVYPGALRYAPYPSTECSPRTFTVQGWLDGRWQPISPPVSVPRYLGEGKTHRVVVALGPRKLRRFRLWISATYDDGKRVHSPDKSVVPPQERSVVIREVEWHTAADVAEAERRLGELRATWGRDLSWWQRKIQNSPDSPLIRAIRQRYGPDLDAAKQDLAALSGLDQDQINAFSTRLGRVRKWLDPWKACLANRPTLGPCPWLDNAVGRLDLRVEPGDTQHEFYPASVALDLKLVEAACGCEVDPYRVQVIEVDTKGQPVQTGSAKQGDVQFFRACRFDRITPDKGTLWWTLRDRTHTRFVAQFLPRSSGPPPEKGLCTLGNCDQFYFDAVTQPCLPGNLWSAAFVDWDSDGRQDLIAGRWTDYCHFWRNVGDNATPKFSEREHWLVIDESETPIAASQEHHGLAFSVAMPVDLDADGRMDIALSNYYGNTPSFHRNLGPASFPIVSRGRKPAGLGHGRLAFGDLNADGKPDAVVVRRLKDKDEVLLQAGEGLAADGRPMFGKPRTLDVDARRGPFSHSRTVPALADIDADGDLDLFLYPAPHLWQYENVGDARAPKFAPGKRVLRNGKPLHLGYYYPWVAWSDWDGDGDLDLVKCTGLFVYVNEGDAKHLKLGKCVRPKCAQQTSMGRSGLKAFDMVDWDGDGDLDHVRLSWCGTDLLVSEWQDGLFRRTLDVEVDANRRDWFGCPDPTEYYSLYGNVKLVDWDSDGDLDLFITSEHSWRFGYIHYYENLGGYKFGPEVKLRPDAACDYVQFALGKTGQAAVVDSKTFVDFLSYPSQGNFDTRGGTIRFWLKPNWRADDGEPHYLFYTAPNPATYGINSQDLKLHYVGLKTDLKLRAPFTLLKTKAGTLRFQTWERSIETKPLDWPPGQWHAVEVGWGEKGRHIVVDGKRLAHAPEPARPSAVGSRIHIGCNSVMLVQREREYPGRWRLHPIERVFPAHAAFDDFEIHGPDGARLLALRFDGDCDSAQGAAGSRTKIGYRCTPGFADLNGDGLLDMVMMIGDGRRGPGDKPEQREWGRGHLYLFPNVGTTAKPRLGKGILLRHHDGKPFRCHIRTQVTCVDWDRDRRIDLILSTENYSQATSNRTVDMFRNLGSARAPVFEPRQPMSRLNALLDAHHEVKLCAVDLTGNGVEDLVTSTDPGTRVIYRSFLDEEPVAVSIAALERRKPR